MSAAPYRPILFDLDGTVADTYPGIHAGVRAMLLELSLPEVPLSVVAPLTGKGVPALVQGVLAAVGAPLELAARAETSYRAHYTRTCTHGAFVYPGLAEVLRRLPGPLALLTNKPRAFTEAILEALGLEGVFTALVAGDDPGVRLKPDPWAVHEALRRLRLPAERAILVGDTRSDSLAAARAEVACCIVRWGHGGPDAASEGDFTAADAPALERLLLHGAGV